MPKKLFEFASSACIRHREVLKDELTFYSLFHRHPVNRALHLVFVPLEWFSILLVLKYGALLGIPQAAAIAGALAFVYYVVLDVVAGLSWLPVQVFMVVLVELVWEVCGWSTTFWVAAALQSIAWAGQVGVGHWLVEKNQPGMATSLTLASVVLSPLMVWYEVLWMLGLGLCLRDEVHLRVADTTVKDN